MSPKEDAARQPWVDIGARLRHAREYLGYSQQAVAGQTGIPRSALSDIENGNRKVDSLEMQKLARLYRYPLTHFLGEDVEQDHTPPALARAITGLTDQDRDEVVRFAEFLRLRKSAETKDG